MEAEARRDKQAADVLAANTKADCKASAEARALQKRAHAEAKAKAEFEAEVEEALVAERAASGVEWKGGGRSVTFSGMGDLDEEEEVDAEEEARPEHNPRPALCGAHS